MNALSGHNYTEICDRTHSARQADGIENGVVLKQGMEKFGHCLVLTHILLTTSPLLASFRGNPILDQLYNMDHKCNGF